MPGKPTRKQLTPETPECLVTGTHTLVPGPSISWGRGAQQ